MSSGVVTQGKMRREALTANATRMDEVVRALKHAGEAAQSPLGIELYRRTDGRLRLSAVEGRPCPLCEKPHAPDSSLGLFQTGTGAA